MAAQPSAGPDRRQAAWSYWRQTLGPLSPLGADPPLPSWLRAERPAQPPALPSLDEAYRATVQADQPLPERPLTWPQQVSVRLGFVLFGAMLTLPGLLVLLVLAGRQFGWRQATVYAAGSLLGLALLSTFWFGLTAAGPADRE